MIYGKARPDKAPRHRPQGGATADIARALKQPVNNAVHGLRNFSGRIGDAFSQGHNPQGLGQMETGNNSWGLWDRQPGQDIGQFLMQQLMQPSAPQQQMRTGQHRTDPNYAGVNMGDPRAMMQAMQPQRRSQPQRRQGRGLFGINQMLGK